ncbi:transposase, partial [Pseudomonas aeruginosa]|uniref:IS66-like element accessory protein TnpA n=1 Tax=Pseudomonas aeruginosa TaxID=287 RepID=UPI0031B6E767
VRVEIRAAGLNPSDVKNVLGRFWDPGQRRSYPKSFKAQVVEECTQPGASVAGVALSHGLNANLVHKWIRRQQAQLPAVPSGFIPIPLVPSVPATPSAADRAIQIAI